VNSRLPAAHLPLNPSAVVGLLRPTQWVKNIFVCAGVLFAGQWHDPKLLMTMTLTFAAFSLMGSSVYVLNDYLDRPFDRSHAVKRNRPLVSGAVSATQGFAAAVVCFGLALLAAGLADARILWIVMVYLSINVAYSLYLKHQPVIDVFCIASGFMLRILAGTWGIHIAPSGWLILTGIFIALFLGFGKRRAELTDAAAMQRRVLQSYSPALLDTFLSIAATGTALSYALYALDPQTIALHHTDRLILTLPFVLFGLFRYLYLLHGATGKGENPSADVFTDPQILLCGLAFAACTFWLLNR
jgi:4-hydroxybenzoate polyprenyltransferase